MEEKKMQLRKWSVKRFVTGDSSCDAFRCMKSTGLVGFGAFVALSGVGSELCELWVFILIQMV